MLSRYPNGRFTASLSKAYGDISRGRPGHMNMFRLRRPGPFSVYTDKTLLSIFVSLMQTLFRAANPPWAMQKKYMRSKFLETVGDRVGSATGEPATPTDVLDYLRELLFALSDVTHLFRLSSFDDEFIEMLLTAQRRTVRWGDGSQ